MKIVTHREQLQQAIGIAARAVSNRSTLPILSNLLVEADEQGLTLSATDLEMGVRVRVPVDVDEAGRTTLPSKLFAEVVGAQPAGPPLEIESDDKDHVTFRCGRSVVEVHGLPAEEFPIIPSLEQQTTLTVPQKLLKDMVAQCIIAVSHDETRARLTGMLFQTEGGRLRLVATDTHRLATRSEALPEIPEADVEAIIPARALREAERLLTDDEDATVDIDFTETQVQFRFENVTILSRLIEGEFPNYRKVIPASHDWTVTATVGDLRDSVRRCAIVSREDNRKLVLRATPAGDLQLSAVSSKIGRADEEIDSVSIDTGDVVGDSLEIAFNADYLLDVLNHLHSDELHLELTAPNQPGAIKPLSDVDYVYVLMPMQLF